MANIKKLWFDLPDSRTKKESGPGFFFNVEARFSDHPVLNPEASKIARHAVYDWSIVLHTRVKRAGGDVSAQRNMTSQALRFDKGAAMGVLDFEAAKKAIMRCWDAWEHYCTFREAPVTVAEKMALEQIAEAPLTALGTFKVLKNGAITSATVVNDDNIDGDEDEDETENVPIVKPARTAPRGRPKTPSRDAE